MTRNLIAHSSSPAARRYPVAEKIISLYTGSFPGVKSPFILLVWKD
jgi:hypothetical protein